MAHEHVYAMDCAKGPGGTRLNYVPGSGPDPARSYCDYPEVVSVQPTLTAGTLRTPGTPGVVKGLTATLTTDDQPVQAARITFTDSHGRWLCEDYTDTHGVATCDRLPTDSGHTFTATFAGGSAHPEQDGGWQTATAVGNLA